MKTTKHPFWISWLIIGALPCLLRCSCLESENPLSDPATSKPDYSLDGVWISRQSDTDEYLHIITSTNTPWMKLVRVDHPKSSGASSESNAFQVFATERDGRHFLNVKLMSSSNSKGADQKPVERYDFFKYHVSNDGILTVLGLNGESLKKAIADKTLSGQYSETTWGVTVRLNGSGDQILNYLVNGKHQAEFTSYRTFHKIESPNDP